MTELPGKKLIDTHYCKCFYLLDVAKSSRWPWFQTFFFSFSSDFYSHAVVDHIILHWKTWKYSKHYDLFQMLMWYTQFMYVNECLIDAVHSVKMTHSSMSSNWKSTGWCCQAMQCIINGGRCCSISYAWYIVQCDLVCFFPRYLVWNSRQWHSYEMSSVSFKSHAIGFFENQQSYQVESLCESLVFLFIAVNASFCMMMFRIICK